MTKKTYTHCHMLATYHKHGTSVQLLSIRRDCVSTNKERILCLNNTHRDVVTRR